MSARRWGLSVLAAVAIALVVPHAVAEPIRVEAEIVTPDGVEACGEVRVRGVEASGGCDLDVRESPVEFTALTLLGDQALGHCGLSYRMLVAGDGSVALLDFELVAPGAAAHSLCGDILPCRKDLDETVDIAKLPWRGALETEDGRIQATVAACFDTCFGRFEGDLVLGVTQTAHGLRLRAERAPLGTSGLEISGSWRMRPFYGGSLRLRTD